jgi:hypothetical protein
MMRSLLAWLFVAALIGEATGGGWHGFELYVGIIGISHLVKSW